MITIMDNDARRIEAPQTEPRCPECQAALRATGPGRRPVYCGRACSSLAYRRRHRQKQQDAVADALISSRVESPGDAEGGAQELLEVARSLERLAVRFLDRLEASRQDDPGPDADRALEALETGVASATQRLLRTAHGLRQELTVARTPAEHESGTGRPGIKSSRVESQDGAKSSIPTRVETANDHGSPVSTRVETSHAPAAESPSMEAVPAGAQFALSPQRSIDNAPTRRGLGEPQRSYHLGGAMVLLTWPQTPGVQAVERGGHLLGWVENDVVAAAPEGWTAVIDGRVVIDADDSQPVLSREPKDALVLLRLVVDQ